MNVARTIHEWFKRASICTSIYQRRWWTEKENLTKKKDRTKKDSLFYPHHFFFLSRSHFFLLCKLLHSISINTVNAVLLVSWIKWKWNFGNRYSDLSVLGYFYSNITFILSHTLKYMANYSIEITRLLNIAPSINVPPWSILFTQAIYFFN